MTETTETAAETATCLKCFNCRVSISRPGNINRSLTDPSLVRRIFCGMGVFPQEFYALKELSTSSVRRRAANCEFYDTNENPVDEAA